MAEIHTLPLPLDRLASKLRDYLTRDAANREEWIAIQMGICVTLAEARADFDGRTGDIAFGEWCDGNGFTKAVINHQTRAAAIAMGKEPEALCKCLEATGRRSLREIHRIEFPTFTGPGKGQDKPTKSPRGAATTNLRPGLRKNTTALAEAAAKEVLDKGNTYSAVEAATGLSGTVLRSAVAREEGRREAVEAAAIDKVVLPTTARGKVDAVLKRERAALAAEYAALKAGLAEKVRQRVLAETAEHLAYLNEERKAAYEEKQWYARLINDHQPPFNETEFMSIWRCLHSDSRGSLSAARLDAAFALFNSRRLQLTGRK